MEKNVRILLIVESIIYLNKLVLIQPLSLWMIVVFLMDSPEVVKMKDNVNSIISIKILVMISPLNSIFNVVITTVSLVSVMMTKNTYVNMILILKLVGK